MIEKRVVILQSNYIPWKGYFDLINLADEFIFLDEVQYTTRDWRNRNKIKTAKGLEWISIPVGDSRNRKISEVKISNSSWMSKHRKSFEINYGRSAYFHEYEFILDKLYNAQFENLSSYNQFVIEFLSKEIFKVKTIFTSDKIYEATGSKTDRLIDIAKKAKATTYLTGPSAKNYLDESHFEKENIKVEYFDYSGYPAYHQLFSGFHHDVTVLDLIFNTGANCIHYMKTFSK